MIESKRIADFSNVTLGSECQLLSFPSPGLGNKYYLLVRGREAVAIDVPKSTRRVESLIQSMGWKLVATIDTHVHNDFLSGGPRLAKELDAEYHAPISNVGFRNTIGEGASMKYMDFSIEPIFTPGHTPEHHSLLIREGDSIDLIFTGGSLVGEGVGRVDLSPQSIEVSADQQFRSLHRIKEVAKTGSLILPTHGFGSYCTVGMGPLQGSPRAADVFSSNQFLGVSREEFLRLVERPVSPIPPHFGHMQELNLAEALSPSDVQSGIQTKQSLRNPEPRSNTVVLDEESFASVGTYPGAVFVGVDGPFVTWLSWYLERVKSYSVRSSSLRTATLFIEGLISGGLPLPDTVVIQGHETSASNSVSHATGDKLFVGPPLKVIDVRHPQEWGRAHIVGSRNLPLEEIISGASLEGGKGVNTYFYCSTGYRSRIAYSLTLGSSESPTTYGANPHEDIDFPVVWCDSPHSVPECRPLTKTIAFN